MWKQSVFLIIIAVLISSCDPGLYTKGQLGAGGGAAAGALLGQAIGRDTGSTLIGAAVGGLLGYIVGNEMDKHDRQQLNNVYETAPSYQTSSWVNPDNGRQYSVTPQPAYTEANTNKVCRPAEIEAVIDGKKDKVMSTACRDASGNWVLQ